jgi:hypothetical protein
MLLLLPLYSLVWLRAGSLVRFTSDDEAGLVVVVPVVVVWFVGVPVLVVPVFVVPVVVVPVGVVPVLMVPAGEVPRLVLALVVSTPRVPVLP